MRDTVVTELTEVLKALAQEGGKRAITSIELNAEVIDASPADLPADYIIVQDQTGHRMPAVKVPGTTYTAGDLVNLIKVKGTEPVAFQQGSGSSSPGISIHDHSTTLLGGSDLRAIEELELDDATTLTLDAAGAVTRTQAYHAIDTFGAAASDNLDTINGGVEGDLLIIRAANSARTVVVRHNQDNIWLSGDADISLDDADDHLALIYDGSFWCDIGWSAGGGGGGYPFDTKELTVDPTDPDAAFTTVALAIAAAGAGDTIRVGAGIHVIANDIFPVDVDVRGSGIGVTILRCATHAVAVRFDGSNHVSDLTIENNEDSVGVTYGIDINGSGVDFRDVRSAVNNPSGNSYAWYPKGVTAKLTNCEGYATGGGTHMAMYTNGGGSADVEIEGGKYEGDDADIDAGVMDDTVALNDPTLVNGTINTVAGFGTVEGSWRNVAGDLCVVEETKIYLDTDLDTALSATADDTVQLLIGGAAMATFLAAYFDFDPPIINLTGATPSIRGSASNFPDLGTTTLAEKLGNVYLGTAKDVYPHDDGGGLFQRLPNHWFVPDDHFNAFAGYTWAVDAPFDGAPSSVSVAAFPSILRLINNDTTEDHFAYKASSAGNHVLTARFCVGTASYAGIRFDDGDDNDYVEFRIIDGAATGLKQFQSRGRNGGGGVVAVNYCDGVPGTFYTLRISFVDASNLAFVYYGVDTPFVTFLGSVTVNFSAARYGMTFGQRVAASSDRGSYFDWLLYT